MDRSVGARPNRATIGEINVNIKNIPCPLAHCSCEGLIRIGDRVRLHSGDYDLETPVEGLGGLMGDSIIAKSGEWSPDCAVWHIPRLSASEIGRQLNMVMLDDDIDQALESRLKNLKVKDLKFPSMIVEQIMAVLEKAE